MSSLRRLAARYRRSVTDRVRRRSRSALVRAMRLTGAAVAAYLVAEAITPKQASTLAPLTALLVVQVTLFSTLTSGLRRVVSVVAGVVLAVGVSSTTGFHWWSLGLIVAGSVILGQLLRLGDHLLEVPISAMLVLAVGDQAHVAANQRIIETVVGAAVGVALNVLLPPAVKARGAGDAVGRLAEAMAALLDRVGDDLVSGVFGEGVDRWLDDARRLSRQVARADRAVTEADESRRLNPRAVGTVDTGPGLRAGLDALEHCSVAVRGLCRAISDRVRDLPIEGDEFANEVRYAFAVLLHDLGTAIRSYGELVRAEVETGGEAEQAELKAALEALGEARARLIELLLVDPRDDETLWELHGSLLDSVQRMLRELDVEERARLRERQARDAASRPLAVAAGRIRASTRQVAGRPLTQLPLRRPRR